MDGKYYHLITQQERLHNSKKQAPGTPPGRIVSATGNNWLLGNWNGNFNQYYAEGWVSHPDATGNTSWNIYTGTRNGANFYSFYNGSTLVDSNYNGSEGPIDLSIFTSQYSIYIASGLLC